MIVNNPVVHIKANRYFINTNCDFAVASNSKLKAYFDGAG